ncbi:hypothetical protein L2755_18640 [Shewanella abyssi]|uniref:hypothetical protein n=1 Tax=Shewanella abyssi TaxID=311789 RepID=UPI0020103E16|nr:hypothetical protein [Shewanella abyssi]MCL1051632.1 hypothetical protein [Shewanella abyssi]
MFSILRRHTLIAFTLLALLSQLMLANGSLMVSNAMADDMPMMSMQGQTDGYPQQVENNAHCSDSADSTQVFPSNAESCCNGEDFCQSDCNHCLVISVTASLFSVLSWPGSNMSDIAMATPMPHFHSISLPQDLRPPIA